MAWKNEGEEESLRRSNGDKANKSAETPKLKLDQVLFLFALVFIGRGIVNLYFLFQGDHFDEFFIGYYSQIILNFLFIVAGIGVFLRLDIGYLIGFLTLAIAFITQSDQNFSERTGGEIMSLFLLIGLWSGWKARKYVKKKLSKQVMLVVSVILIGTIIFEAVQPTTEDLYEKYRDLAIKEKDISICDKIRDDFYIGECTRRFMWEFKVKDSSLCDRLKDESAQGNCYITLVRITGDNVYCNKIKSEWLKENCLKIKI